MAAEIQDLIGFIRQLACRPDLVDDAVPHKKATVGQLPLVVIHGDNVRVPN
jgi:hypothetical protein